MQNGEGFSGTGNYEPNTLGEGMPGQSVDPVFGGRPTEGADMRRKIPLTNDFQQAGERYRSLSKKDLDHLVDNIIDPLAHATMDIQKRTVEDLKICEYRARKSRCSGTEALI